MCFVIKGGADMIGGYGMIGGMFWFVVLTGLLSVTVVALVVWAQISTLRTQLGTAAPDPQEILRRRYARGEISRDEFDQARAALR